MIVLIRLKEHNNATFGALLCDGRPIAVTLEDAWKDNARMVSCIPQGTYTIRRHTSPKFGEVFRVEDVPGRSDILIHAGNTDADTHGCILLGKQFGAVGDKWGILQSNSLLRNGY